MRPGTASRQERTLTVSADILDLTNILDRAATAFAGDAARAEESVDNRYFLTMETLCRKLLLLADKAK